MEKESSLSTGLDHNSHPSDPVSFLISITSNHPTLTQATRFLIIKGKSQRNLISKQITERAIHFSSISCAQIAANKLSSSSSKNHKQFKAISTNEERPNSNMQIFKYTQIVTSNVASKKNVIVHFFRIFLHHHTFLFMVT